MVPHGTESSLATTWRVLRMAAVSPSSANFSSSDLDGNLVNKLSTLLTGVESSFLAPLMVLATFWAVTAELVDPPWSFKTSALGKLGMVTLTVELYPLPCPLPIPESDPEGVEGRVTEPDPPATYWV